MQILPGARDKVVVQIVVSGGHSGQLLLHDSNKALSYFVQFIAGKQVRYLGKIKERMYVSSFRAFVKQWNY